MLRFLLVAAFLVAANAASSGLRVLPVPARSVGRIVGGESAEISEVPYQVALLLDYWGTGSFSLTCGGSIISSKVVVSAAHCPDGTVAREWKIRVGSSTHGSGGQVVEVSQLNIHPSYDSYNIDYDISLYILASELVLGNSVAPIPLATQGQVIADNSSALISGWGTLSEGGSIPSSLRKVSINTVNQAQCKTTYAGYGWAITDRMICAGVPEGGKDACQGDSGGPLVVSGQLVGITSWGYGCARKGIPGVWSRVPVLRSWVDETLEGIQY